MSKDIVRLTVDTSRCPLCGAANECAIAAGEGSAGEPCWCVAESFPATLLDRANSLDDGASCVCRACLESAR